MPEIIQDKKVFTLLEVTSSIKKTLLERYSSTFWVKAEMSKLNHYSYSGHCYPVILQKSEGKIVAEIRSIIWKDDFVKINAQFVKILNEPLKDGINILFCAKVSFDPVYGLSLRIIDIDPSYSLGELEREKQETIQKLHSENVFYLNKNKPLELLPKRIAIISVKTGDGYSDFMNVLSKNKWNYNFFAMLFPALLQGDRAVDSIINQLFVIQKIKHHFDAVAIIRGGGGDLSLSCYNNYELAKAITQFPIPVITGIGHSTNQTVVEMICYQSFITPTDAANFFIQKFHDFKVPLQLAQKVLVEDSIEVLNECKQELKTVSKVLINASKYRLLKSKSNLKEELLYVKNETKSLIKHYKQQLSDTVYELDSTCSNTIKQEKYELKNVVLNLKKDSLHSLKSSSIELNIVNKSLKKSTQSILPNRLTEIHKTSLALQLGTQYFFKNTNKDLSLLEKNLDFLNPEKLFKRGYSITLHNGKPLTSINPIKPGDELKTITSDGQIISTVNQIKQDSNE